MTVRLLVTVALAMFVAATSVIAPGTVLAQAPQSKPGLKTVVIPVEGMACIVCAASVKQAIKSLEGVSRVEVDVVKKSARVTFMPAKISAGRIVARINDISGSFSAGTPREVE